jgi:cell division protein FtsQ
VSIKSGLLFGLGLVLAGLLWLGGAAVSRLPMFQLDQVRVLGAQHVSPQQTQWVIHEYVHGNLFHVSLAQVRDGFEKLSWVRSVDVRRKWPNELVVRLVEHQALAHWNQAGLVDRRGEVFMAATSANLPYFNGPSGSSGQVTQTWVDMTRILAPLGRHPVVVTLNERGGWTTQLDNGVVIALGRDDQAMNRLVRWVSLYPAMQAQLQSPLVSVDLRYPQGFAVQLMPVGATDVHTQGKVS